MRERWEQHPCTQSAVPGHRESKQYMKEKRWREKALHFLVVSVSCCLFLTVRRLRRSHACAGVLGRRGAATAPRYGAVPDDARDVGRAHHRLVCLFDIFTDSALLKSDCCSPFFFFFFFIFLCLFLIVFYVPFSPHLVAMPSTGACSKKRLRWSTWKLPKTWRCTVSTTSRLRLVLPLLHAVLLGVFF